MCKILESVCMPIDQSKFQQHCTYNVHECIEFTCECVYMSFLFKMKLYPFACIKFTVHTSIVMQKYVCTSSFLYSPLMQQQQQEYTRNAMHLLSSTMQCRDEVIYSITYDANKNAKHHIRSQHTAPTSVT